MKIILKEDVHGLGYKDDVVEVKNGYGRNYLIPTGKGVIATPSALKVLPPANFVRKLVILKYFGEKRTDADGKSAKTGEGKRICNVIFC